MAYPSSNGQYQEMQYQSRPQNYDEQPNGYAQTQYDQGFVGYQRDHRQARDNNYHGYQQDAYAHNNQHGQHYEPGWEQYNGQDQRYNESYGYQNPQSGQQQHYQDTRQYQYDERYRSNHREAPQYERARPNTSGTGGRRSPQGQRPGTSASSRKVRQERILDKADHESPKAMAWDNPFGVFPGTKKDLEKKKKEVEEVRPDSRVDASANKTTTSSPSRPAPVDQRVSTKTSLEEPSRPHTSHSGQAQRQAHPTTNFNQPLGPLADMPLRKKPPTTQVEIPTNGRGQVPRSMESSNPGRVGLPARPAPQRSGSGPVPDRSNANPEPRASQDYYGHSNSSAQHHTYVNERQDADRDVGSNPRYYQQNLHNTNRQDQSIAPQYPESRWNDPGNKTLPAPVDHGMRAHRGTAPVGYTQNRAEPGMPDFAAMPPQATEDTERNATLQGSPAVQPGRFHAYRKPTYGDASTGPPSMGSEPVPTTSSQTTRNGYAATPVAEFDFGLPSTKQQQSPQGRVEQARPIVSGYPGHPQQQMLNQNVRPEQSNQQKFPPRNGSRADPRVETTNNFMQPYDPSPVTRQLNTRQPLPPNQAGGGHGWTQPQRTPGEHRLNERGYLQDYNNVAHQAHDQNHEWHQQDSNEPRMLVRTYTEPANQSSNDQREDPYNHGYGQRGQVGRNQAYGQDPYSAASYQQPSDSQPYHNSPSDQYGNAVPARPRTANSARAPARQYPEQALQSSRPPIPGLPSSDRNHPVPIRPGLMQSTPSSARVSAPSTALTSVPTPVQQVSPPRNSQSQQVPPTSSPAPAPSRKAPVTAEELNELRVAFRDRPSDDKVGILLAKRLVEASGVLANEGGKADPKTTARNCERYINDAYKILKKLVASGSPDAMFYLADCYGQGLLGLEKNPKEAFQLYTSAAKLGHAQAAFRVAVCCEMGADSGGGTRRDHVKAVQFYKRAATLGDAASMFKMGMILLKGLLGQQPNKREGISWLKRAAERADEENPHALHELALLYETAQSTDVLIRDEPYALQLFNQAANLGYKYSQHRLGSAFEYGTLGVQIDPRQSIAWYSRAAQQGETQSEFALSGWYLTGSEPLLAQSDTEAYLWARKAAQNGLAKAEYAMGYYTEVGIGCRPDLEEAKKWYFRAAAQMDNRARERLEEIKRGGGRKEKTRVSRSGVGKQNEGECSVM